MAGTAIEKYKKRLAKEADDYGNEEVVAGSFITTRGGILKYGEEELPGNEMCVIVLDAIHENTYYPDKFNPNAVLPPKCFALGRSEKEMEPHENVLDPDDEGADESYFELQADSCADCEWAEWGSADTGKGKACSNRRRLAIIPAGRFSPTGKRKETELEVFEDPEHFREAEIAFLKLPVTSVKNWSKYVHELRKEHSVPPFAVLTHIYLESDPKSQFKVHFDCLEVLDSEDILDILFARNDEAKEVIEQPYSEPSSEERDTPAEKGRTGLKGLKKKRGE